MIKKILPVMFIMLIVFLASACSTFRKVEPVERVITKTEVVYEEIPEEFLICPLPPVVEPESIITEQQYNEQFVLQLYTNNITCFGSIEDVRKFNENLRRLNTSEVETLTEEE